MDKNGYSSFVSVVSELACLPLFQVRENTHRLTVIGAMMGKIKFCASINLNEIREGVEIWLETPNLRCFFNFLDGT